MWLAAVFVAITNGRIIKYGDHVTLKHSATGSMLHSLRRIQWQHGGQIVTNIPEDIRGDDYTSVTWVLRSPIEDTNILSPQRLPYFSTGMSQDEKSGQMIFRAKSAGAPVRCGDSLRLEHAESNLLLTVYDEKTQITRANEVAAQAKIDQRSLLTVECAGEFWMAGEPAKLRQAANMYIGSLPSAIYDKQYCMNRCPMRQHIEVSAARHGGNRGNWIAKHILEINNSSDEIFDLGDDDEPIPADRDEL